MEGCKKEFENLKKLFNNGKMQFQEFTKNVIVKVADLETSTAKVALAEVLFKMQIKFVSHWHVVSCQNRTLHQVQSRTQTIAARNVPRGLSKKAQKDWFRQMQWQTWS